MDVMFDFGPALARLSCVEPGRWTEPEREIERLRKKIAATDEELREICELLGLSTDPRLVYTFTLHEGFIDLKERVERAEAAVNDQGRIEAWLRRVFTEQELASIPERALRMLEEAVELAQACAVPPEQAHRLIDYVFARPVGKVDKEIAGVLVTTYALAECSLVDARRAFETEVERINTPEIIERVRRRQAEKREALQSGSAEPEALGQPRIELPERSPLRRRLAAIEDAARPFVDRYRELDARAGSPGNLAGSALVSFDWLRQLEDALDPKTPPRSS